MNRSSELFDRAALSRARARAARDPADFLQIEAADMLCDRLLEVNRRFTAPAIIGPRAALWRDRLVAGGAIARADLVADADTLDLAPGAHDLVVHALCLHVANDPVGQLVQMRRALRPDGLALAAMFGGQSLSELRSTLAAAESALAGGLSPRVAPMGEIRDLGGLVQRAGLALPVADSLALTVTYPGILALMRDLRAMGEANVLSARRRSFLRRDIVTRAEEIYRDHFPADAPGRIRATAEIVVLTGWAPADSQPRALRPGSARTRLADALGAEEVRLPGPVPRDPTAD